MVGQCSQKVKTSPNISLTAIAEVVHIPSNRNSDYLQQVN
jgi:hypothetical protein